MWNRHSMVQHPQDLIIFGQAWEHMWTSSGTLYYQTGFYQELQKLCTSRDVSPKLNVLPLLPKIAADTNIICVCYTPFCAVAHLGQGMNVVSWSLPGNKSAFVLGGSWGLESAMDDENLVFAMPVWIHQTKGFLQHTIKTFLSSKEMAQERYEVMPFLVLVLEFDI